MKCGIWMSGMALAVATVAGCGGSANSADASKEAAQALTVFLEAVRTGNDGDAEKMLTPLARQRTREAELAVTPPGRDTASYEIGEFEPVEGGINIAVAWTDLDASGQPHTDQMTWLMRKVEEGWRVAGMGAKPFEDRPQFFLDFENPDEMQRQLEQINEEFQRRAVERQAQQPSTDPGAVQ